MAPGPGSGQAVGVAATSTRRAGDNPEEWAAWVREACAAVGVDPATVDVDAILDLTSQVAHRYARPMAPVSAYILGIAVGSNPTASPEYLRRVLEDAATAAPLPKEP